jgi:Cu+-exporting ATPase
MADARIAIEDMSCAHCVSRVKQAIDGLGGVSASTVEIGSAEVKFDDSRLSVADIEAAVEKAGYKIKRG